MLKSIVHVIGFTLYCSCFSFIGCILPEIFGKTFCTSNDMGLQNNVFRRKKYKRPFIYCKAESERNGFKYVNLSMFANESFLWIAIRNWSQNPRQLMMSPSNLESHYFVILPLHLELEWFIDALWLTPLWLQTEWLLFNFEKKIKYVLLKLMKIRNYL